MSWIEGDSLGVMCVCQWLLHVVCSLGLVASHVLYVEIAALDLWIWSFGVDTSCSGRK